MPITEYKTIPDGLSLLSFSHQYPVKATVTPSIDRTEYGLGRSYTYVRRDNPIRVYNFSVSGEVSAMYTLFLTFADRQARAKLFYFQDPVYSLTLDTAPTAGDTTLVFDQTINLVSDLDCLVIEFDDVLICYPIFSAAGNEITITEALPVDVPLYASVGYAFRARFDQDEIEFKHSGGSTCESSISIIEVAREVGE